MVIGAGAGWVCAEAVCVSVVVVERLLVSTVVSAPPRSIRVKSVSVTLASAISSSVFVVSTDSPVRAAMRCACERG